MKIFKGKEEDSGVNCTATGDEINIRFMGLSWTCTVTP